MLEYLAGDLVWVLLTLAVVGGVGFFFYKQSHPSNHSQVKKKIPKEFRKESSKESKQPAKSKEGKEKKDRVRKEKPEVGVAAPKQSTKKAAKEQDEDSAVLEFLKGKEFTLYQSDKSKSGKQNNTATKKNNKQASADEEADKDMVLIKRKKESKDKPVSNERESESNEKKGRKKEFFKDDEDQKQADKKAAAEARKNKPPRAAGEKKPRESADGDFQAPTERKQRERKEKPKRDDDEVEHSEKRERQPELPPVFASPYEQAHVDDLLNNLTRYYSSNPQPVNNKKKSNSDDFDE